MIYTAAHHHWTIKMVWLHFFGTLISSILTYSQCSIVIPLVMFAIGHFAENAFPFMQTHSLLRRKLGLTEYLDPIELLSFDFSV